MEGLVLKKGAPVLMVGRGLNLPSRALTDLGNFWRPRINFSIKKVIIPSYHAPAERQLQIKMASAWLMVRQAHLERVPGPFVLSLSKGGRAIFRAAGTKYRGGI